MFQKQFKCRAKADGSQERQPGQASQTVGQRPREERQPLDPGVTPPLPGTPPPGPPALVHLPNHFFKEIFALGFTGVGLLSFVATSQGNGPQLLPTLISSSLPGPKLSEF